MQQATPPFGGQPYGSPPYLFARIACKTCGQAHYGGINQVLRETAGTFTLLEQRLSDTAFHKRLKACLPWVKDNQTQSWLDIDRQRARQHSPLAGAVLTRQAARLYTSVLEKRTRRRCGEHWNRLDRPRPATPWRVSKLLRQELAIAISEVLNWNLSRWHACPEVLQERPRQRQRQTLPERVNRLIAFCRAKGLSNIGEAGA